MAQKQLWIAVITMLFALGACKASDGFQGSSEKKQQPAPTPITQTIDQTPTPTDLPKVDTPSTAITKGSFTVWAEPPNPTPAESYVIRINVKIPSTTVSYRYQDLAGEVIGTDGYKRGIGRESRGPYGGTPSDPLTIKSGVLGEDQFRFDSGVAQISLFVPGAERAVRDTIKVSSTLLNESQNIVLVFGQ